jgi:hypothetical protein
MNEFRLAEHLYGGRCATFACLLKQLERVRRSSLRRRGQVSDSHQVVSGRRKLKDPTHYRQTSMARLAQQADGLQPAEDLFNSFALALTNGITRVPGRALIYRATAPALSVLRHMWRHASGAQLRDKALRVITLIGPPK